MPNPAPRPAADQPSAPKRQLTLLDGIAIIVTIIVGTGIYKSSPMIAGCAPSVVWLFGLWAAGAAISLIGALCYAELTTMYPRAGGDYFFITRAYGKHLGFLFAWSELWITRPGNIGAMAFVFAQYAYELCPWTVGAAKPAALVVYAAVPVVVLTAINIIGVREGKWTQNLLTAVKLAGPLLILSAGLMFTPAEAPAPQIVVPAVEAAAQAAKEAAPQGVNWTNIHLALILILFTYGGWSEIATVGAEVRRPEKNMLRSLVLGVLAVAVIYLVINAVFVYVMGFEGFSKSKAIAADVLRHGLGDWAAKLVSLIITISALGAMSAQVFTGARIYYAMGRDHRFYAWLGRWSQRWGTPAWSLVAQAVATLVLIVLFGTAESEKEGAFEQLVGFTAPLFWTFFASVGLSLFVFRKWDPDAPRPFRVPLYPLLPLIFILSSLFLLSASVNYTLNFGGDRAWWWLGWLGVMLVGVVLLFITPPAPAPPDEATERRS